MSKKWAAGLAIVLVGMVLGFQAGRWGDGRLGDTSGLPVAIQFEDIPRGIAVTQFLEIPHPFQKFGRLQRIQSSCGCAILEGAGALVRPEDPLRVAMKVSSAEIHKSRVTEVRGDIIFDDGESISDVLLARVFLSVVEHYEFSLVPVEPISEIIPGDVWEFIIAIDRGWLSSNRGTPLAPEVHSASTDLAVEWFSEVSSANQAVRLFSLGLSLQAKYDSLDDEISLEVPIGGTDFTYEPTFRLLGTQGYYIALGESVDGESSVTASVMKVSLVRPAISERQSIEQTSTNIIHTAEIPTSVMGDPQAVQISCTSEGRLIDFNLRADWVSAPGVRTRFKIHWETEEGNR